jgi:hypothetical protein
MLQIFIALTNPSFLAGFEPTNLGSNGKHDNCYTTEKDINNVKNESQLYVVVNESVTLITMTFVPLKKKET